MGGIGQVGTEMLMDVNLCTSVRVCAHRCTLIRICTYVLTNVYVYTEVWFYGYIYVSIWVYKCSAGVYIHQYLYMLIR